jgi:D-alanyl-D-alanine carboxypeptidase (penicillin-binding protein 5/6)
MSTALRRISLLFVLALVVVTAAGAAWLHARDDSRTHYLGSAGWPSHGQAAYVLGTEGPQASPRQRPAPIASLAKVMTAYLVLRNDPLDRSATGFSMNITQADVADTARRAARDESVVAVARGEVLTERQALAALLLPSANNVAIMLARHVAGSVGSFVAQMNRAAFALGMHSTTYTDPSGYRASTVSTASDQVMLAQVAMQNRTFAGMVATESYVLPVAGTVHNTDELLGTHGFVGIKTGSDDDAGGCFMFRTRRMVDGTLRNLTGVVLGQLGHNLVRTGQYAALQLADRVAPVTT